MILQEEFKKIKKRDLFCIQEIQDGMKIIELICVKDFDSSGFSIIGTRVQLSKSDVRTEILNVDQPPHFTLQEYIESKVGKRGEFEMLKMNKQHAKQLLVEWKETEKKEKVGYDIMVKCFDEWSFISQKSRYMIAGAAIQVDRETSVRKEDRPLGH